jgi:hypothetical protein
MVLANSPALPFLKAHRESLSNFAASEFWFRHAPFAPRIPKLALPSHLALSPAAAVLGINLSGSRNDLLNFPDFVGSRQ